MKKPAERRIKRHRIRVDTEEPIPSAIKRLRAEREFFKLEALAAASGVSVAQIKKAEAGKPIGIPDLNKLALCFGVARSVISSPKHSFGRAADDVSTGYINGDDSASLITQLRTKLGISPAQELSNLDENQLRRLGNPRMIVGNIILDGAFVGFTGVEPDSLIVDWHPNDIPRGIPHHIIESRKEIEKAEQGSRNGRKVFLDSWRPPIIDQGNRVELVTSRSDWWMRKAVGRNIKRLQADILEGRFSLSGLSRPLDTTSVVITADNKIALAYRGDGVEYHKNTWSVPGESMDADLDLDARTRSVSPKKTVSRMLNETDELNLPFSDTTSEQMTFVALATEWDTLTASLVVIVNLRRATSTKVADRFPKGEHEHIHFVDFEVNACLPLLRDDYTIEIPGSFERKKLNDMSRFSILAALFNRFGFHEMMTAIYR